MSHMKWKCQSKTYMIMLKYIPSFENLYLPLSRAFSREKQYEFKDVMFSENPGEK